MIARARGWVAALLAIAAPACGRPAVHRAGAWARDSAGVRLTTVTARPDRVPIWRLRPGTSIPDSAGADTPALVEVTDAQWLTHGRILVVDSRARTMYVVGRDGTPTTLLGRPGPGPGEFAQLGVVSVTPDDSVFAYDPVRRAIQVFHPNAGFVRSINLAVSLGPTASTLGAWRQGPGRLVVLAYRKLPLSAASSGQRWTLWPGAALVALVDEAGNRIAGPVEFEGSYSASATVGDLRLPFSNRPFLFSGAKSLVYGSGQEFSLTLADETTLAPRMRIDWPASRERIARTELSSLTHARLEQARSAMTRELIRTQFSPKFLPRFRPALASVLVAPDGNIWAGRFEPAIDYPIEALWYVFDATGAPVGRVRLPSRSHLTAVRGDSVLLVQRDSTDAWGVRLYTVLR